MFKVGEKAVNGPVGGVGIGGTTGGGVTGGNTNVRSGFGTNGFLRVSFNITGGATENTAESPNRNGAMRVRSLSFAVVQVATPGMLKTSCFAEALGTIWRFIERLVSLQ